MSNRGYGYTTGCETGAFSSDTAGCGLRIHQEEGEIVPEDDVDLSELDCLVFVDGAPNTTDLTTWIAEAVDGCPTGDGAKAPGLEMFAEDNDDADPSAKLDDIRGFLFFDHFVEIYFAPSVGSDQRVTAVSKLLEHLWGLSLPAVAACDYEDQLPRRAETADPELAAPPECHAGRRCHR